MSSNAKRGRGRPLTAAGKFIRELPELPSHLWVTNELVELHLENLSQLPKTRAEIQRHFNPGKTANPLRHLERVARISATWALLQTYVGNGSGIPPKLLAKSWRSKWEKGERIAPPELTDCSHRMLTEYIREARKQYGATC